MERMLLYQLWNDPGNVQPLLRGIKCECKICKVAKSSINSKSTGSKRGLPSSCTTLNQETEERPSQILICSKCFSKIILLILFILFIFVSFSICWICFSRVSTVSMVLRLSYFCHKENHFIIFEI